MKSMHGWEKYKKDKDRFKLYGVHKSYARKDI